MCAGCCLPSTVLARSTRLALPSSYNVQYEACKEMAQVCLACSKRVPSTWMDADVQRHDHVRDKPHPRQLSFAQGDALSARARPPFWIRQFPLTNTVPMALIRVIGFPSARQ